MAASCVRGGLGKILAKIYLLKEWPDIGIGFPRRWLSHHPWMFLKKTCRCGTSGYGLAGMVVLGAWLDLMILEVLSNL